jgi:2'-5' RNA ligase
MFVAVWPSKPVTDRLRDVPQPNEPGVRWVPRTNWHVTLRFLGEVEADAVAARLAPARLPRATATLGPTVARLGRKLIVVPVAGVDELATAVADATAGIGHGWAAPFRGHLTLARTWRDARSSSLGTEIAAEFDVSEVALVRSDVDHTGSTYTTIATFPTQ